MDESLFLVVKASLSTSVFICLFGKITLDSCSYSTWCQKWHFSQREISRVRSHNLSQELNIFVNQLFSELCNR